MEGQERMRGGAGREFDHAALGEIPECRDQVPVMSIEERAARPPERLSVADCQRLPRGLVSEAMDLGVGEQHQPVEMSHVARLQQRIGEHAEERRAE